MIYSSVNVLVIETGIQPATGSKMLTFVAWGKAVNESPIRKWPGVRGERSFGSLDNGDRGLEFNQASICVRSVYNSLYVNCALPTTCFIWYFADLTAPPHKPPKCSARGDIKCHFICSLDKKSLMLFWNLPAFKNSWSS